jgi:hypothetical protein
VAMSINIEAFRKNKDFICVHNKLYTMEEYIERVDILEAQLEELKAKNERLRIRIKELERIKIPPKFDYKEMIENSPDGRPFGLPFNYDCPCYQENKYDGGDYERI